MNEKESKIMDSFRKCKNRFMILKLQYSAKREEWKDIKEDDRAVYCNIG